MRPRAIGFALLLLSVFAGSGVAQKRQQSTAQTKPHDFGKSLIEAPLIKSISGPTNRAHIQKRHSTSVLDLSKRRIEAPVESLIKRGRKTPTPTPKKRRSLDKSRSSLNHDNPKVKPGLVDWHGDMKSALSASQSSGKPILIFYLLGELDREYT
ncbi:MAG: hypothetical protein ACI97A_004114 [Planctomycetota bacterium]|jgi:hypothetical protein